MRNAGWALAAVLVLGATAHANVSYGPIHVRVDSPPPATTDNYGYIEYPVYLTNRSTEKSYRVTLIVPAYGGGGRDDVLRDVRRTVDVPPAEGPKQAQWTIVRVSLFQPAVPVLSGNQMAVDIDGRRQDEVVALNVLSRGRGSVRGYSFPGAPPTGTIVRDGPFVLLSQGLSNDFEGLGFNKQVAQLVFDGQAAEEFQFRDDHQPLGAPPPPGGLPRRPGMPGAPPMPAPPTAPARPVRERLRVPPRLEPTGVSWHWPTWWAGGLLTLPTGELPTPNWRESGRTVSPQYHRLPIAEWSPHWLSYTRYAGVTLLASEFAVLTPEVRTALLRHAESGGVLTLVGTLPDTVKLPASWQAFRVDPGCVGYLAGLGQAYVMNSDNLRSWGQLRWGLLVNAWENTGKPWQAWMSVMNANRELPVVQDLGVPVGGLFALMVGFAVVIGPLNLWILTRYKKRIWLLVTAPIISLITCVSVFGVMILLEGWDGHLRSTTFTLLDESTLRTQTIGWTAYYSPLTPSDGLRFGYDVELQLQIADDSGGGPYYGYRSRTSGTGTARTINWTNEQHLNSGWVSARVPSHFVVRKSDQQRRERVVITHTGAKVLAVNALKMPVRELWYADAAGQLYQATEIAAGAEVTLTLTDKKLPNGHGRFGAWRSIYLGRWGQFLDQTIQHPDKVLTPRTYLAALDDDPFLEDGLKGVRERKRSAIVLGVLERGAP
jgi:hypothetical protein